MNNFKQKTMKKQKQEKSKKREKFLNERIVKEVKLEPSNEVVTNLSGSIGFEIELSEQSYSTRLQISTENNFIACVMARDVLTASIKHQALPTLTEKEKMPPKLLQDHITARNILEVICTGFGSHILSEAKKGKIKADIIESAIPKIITLK